MLQKFRFLVIQLSVLQASHARAQLFHLPGSFKQQDAISQNPGIYYQLETGPKYTQTVHEQHDTPIWTVLPNLQPLGTSWCLLVIFQYHAVCNMSCFLLTADSKVASWALWGKQTSFVLLRTWLGPLTSFAHLLF